MIKESEVDSYRKLIEELANETLDGRIKSVEEQFLLQQGSLQSQAQIIDGIVKRLNPDVVAAQIEDFEKRIAELESTLAKAVLQIEASVGEMFKTIEDQRLGLMDLRLDDIENHLGI